MNKTIIEIRGYHCDAYGHVNNARYLEFLEESRWNWLSNKEATKFFEDKGLLFVVVHLSISYKKALVPGDEIEVSVSKVIFKNMSVVLTQEITVGEESAIAAIADVTFVLLGQESGKPVKIDEELIKVFMSLSDYD